jgi:hypothetical protein
MDNSTSQPGPPATTRRRRTRTRTVVALGILAFSTSAAAQVRQDGRRLTADQAFETVWVVDRDMPEFDVWRTLTHVTSSDGFQPVVLHGGDDERWTASLEHLLWLLPQGDSVWVSEAETVFDVDGWMTPDRVADLDPSTGPLVVSAGTSVDPIAALIAMRLDGVLTADASAAAGRSVAVGIAGPRMQTDGFDVSLATRTAALAYVNRLAESTVVMVVRKGGLLPEHVLWAFQRDAKILEVDPPPYGIDDGWSEFVAVGEVSRQIHAGLADLLGDDPPEAMVIAGDWDEIPFRFAGGLGGAEATRLPAGAPFQCDRCDNGVYEYAADLAYANLDEDPSGIPDVPVGRLMSPFRDLLAIQTVLGIWREHGAFAAPTDGVFLGLLGTSDPDHRRVMFETWRDAFPGQLWSAIGPEAFEDGYHLDRDAFFRLADRAEIVVVHGHGHPDFLTPDGNPFNQAIAGKDLRERAGEGVPSFWFLHACGTGKPDIDDHVAEQTLLVGLQSRLAFGSLMGAENIAGGASDPSWWIGSVAPGLTVGELVRRFAAAGAMAYRDGGPVAAGLPGTGGSAETKRANGLGALFWIGDPLTPMEAGG